MLINTVIACDNIPRVSYNSCCLIQDCILSPPPDYCKNNPVILCPLIYMDVIKSCTSITVVIVEFCLGSSIITYS